MTRAVFITNPLSHSVAKHGSILGKSATNNARILRYIINDFTLVSDYIALLAKKGVDQIFIEGGDGTVHGVLTEIMHQKDHFTSLPNFILLPGGMTNLIAAHAGLIKPSPAKINAILAQPKSAEIIDLPLLKIEYDKLIQFGFLFSTGALPNGTRYCQDTVHTKGINGAMAVSMTLLRVLLARGKEREIIMRPTPYALDTEEGSIDGEHVLSLATTLPSLMIGLNPFWGKGNGPVHISHMRAGAKHHVRNVTRLLKKTQSEDSVSKLEEDGFKSWSVDEAIMHYDGDMVLDGEFMPKAKSSISLSATQPFSFIRSI